MSQVIIPCRRYLKESRSFFVFAVGHTDILEMLRLILAVFLSIGDRTVADASGTQRKAYLRGPGCLLGNDLAILGGSNMFLDLAKISSISSKDRPFVSGKQK